MKFRLILLTALLCVVLLTAAVPAFSASYRVNVRSGSHDMTVTKLTLTNDGHVIWEDADVPFSMGPGQTVRHSTGPLEMTPNDFEIDYSLDGGDPISYSKGNVQKNVWYPLPEEKRSTGTAPELMFQDETDAVEPGSLGAVKAVFR
jgi:hypothetical protein